ncbi:MAG: MlaD family protein [Sulfurimicrobium sp.]|nr:MlaD family protein [Sulfurimicrobium sp.]MDO9190325.1 MlaD family protein [Sulfurimicrobium sp.]MDP1705858.1 MlaD family protein [Sulfurimicrobium sp.]MDP2198583.1 MlaD family protein [Sulfurimicrobium sp.]MDP2962178.1 MlaD family protein [Sulfurimicrobium sp.]
METKVNYTIVGLFVILLFIAMVAGILWLSGAAQYRKNYDTYLAYMKESVAGLNLNAPVKYRGVEVGRVKRISLDHGERVRLELDIEHDTPIKENTIAVLRVQGLTGIAQVELSGGTREAPDLKAKPDEKYPVIKTAPSLLMRMDTAITDLLSSLNQVSVRLSGVLDDDNRLAFRNMMADMATLTATLAARKESIDTSLQGAARTMDNTAKVSAELPQLIDRMSKSVAALEKMAKDASRASMAVHKTAEGVSNGMIQVTDSIVPELERAVAEMRDLSTTLKRVSEEVERSPNMLLLGKQPDKRGPGE